MSSIPAEVVAFIRSERQHAQAAKDAWAQAQSGVPPALRQHLDHPSVALVAAFDAGEVAPAEILRIIAFQNRMWDLLAEQRKWQRLAVITVSDAKSQQAELERIAAQMEMCEQALDVARAHAMTRPQAREHAILTSIRARGLDPQALPRMEGGGDETFKREIRDELFRINATLWGEGVRQRRMAFRNKWQRMRDAGLLRDAEQSE